MPPPRHRRRALPLTVLLLAAVPVALAAHLSLARSEPADGALLRVPPPRLRLWSREEPTPPSSRVTPPGPAGAVAVGELHAGGERSLVADVPNRLAPGQYRLAWRTAGDDGHTVDGAITFGVAKPAPPQP